MTPLLPGQVLGFLPVRRGESGRGTPQGPSGRKVTSTGFTASVLDEPIGISPDPKKPPPRQSVLLHPTCCPPACATMVLRHPCRLTVVTYMRPKRNKMGHGTGKSSIAAKPKRTTSTTISVEDRTRHQGHTRPLLARRA
jgi:hypothetical protein